MVKVIVGYNYNMYMEKIVDNRWAVRNYKLITEIW